ncbi:MAG: putative ABC transport system ATP-binding protein [bacterium]|jgi:putative ABC transport system ATP-binding protein
MMNKNVLEIKNLSKKFELVTALENINFEVEEGEWLAIMGPSGSGKSTLLNILSCLDTATSGDYYLEDKNTALLSEKQRTTVRRERIGLIFQQFHLVPYLTALENVMLSQYYHSVTDKEDAIAALKRVGMGHRMTHLPSQLSGGEQQRVCIARSIINQPAFLLADEPTGNLDEENEKLVIELFQQLHSEGKTIIMVTHNPDMGELAERVLRLNHGKIDSIQEIAKIA